MLTTHYLEEADTIADRVVVIDHGVVIADDSAARLKSSLGDLVRLGFGSVADATIGAERAFSIPGAVVDLDGAEVTLRVAHGRDLAAGLVTDLAWQGSPVERIEVVGPTLDDVFLDLTGRSLRETSETTQNDESKGAAA